jgi:hypothetical protein
MPPEAAGSINWIAVVVAAVSTFMLGGLWYSPMLFGKAWMKAAAVSEADLSRGNPAVIYGLSFVLALLAAAVFALFLGPAPALGFALGAGASAGACWVAAGMAITYLFERRPVALFLVNGGYLTVQFTIYGLILGLWH